MEASPIHVLRKVEYHGDIRALSREAGSRAARQHRGPGGAAGGHGGFHVRGIAGQDHADGKLPVVRRVGRVHCAEAHVEVDFAAQRCLEPGFEFAVSRKVLVRERGTVGKNRKSAHAGMVTPGGFESISDGHSVYNAAAHAMIVLSIRRVVPTHAATAKSAPGNAVSTGSSVSQSTSSM